LCIAVVFTVLEDAVPAFTTVRYALPTDTLLCNRISVDLFLGSYNVITFPMHHHIPLFIKF